MEPPRSFDESELCARLGADAFERLVAAFYRRVPGDELLGPMYPEADMAGAEARLAAFLVFRFGGSDRYVRERGHPRLRQRHFPFPIDAAARDRWLALMDEALDETGVPPEEARFLRAFFQQVAHFLQNRS